MRKVFFTMMVMALAAAPSLSLAAVPANTVGRILLQVQSAGEAWYVSPVTQERVYFKNGEAAFALLRSDGLGITSRDLALIPVGVEDRYPDTDGDGDGIYDSIERAMGVNPADPDSDDDGYLDGVEIANGFDPLNAVSGARPAVDMALAKRLAGRILLDVQKNGEAWYVHPVTLKRYYLKDGNAAYAIMRYLGLGITNNDLMMIPVVAGKEDSPLPQAADDSIVISDLNYASISITEIAGNIGLPLTFNVSSAGKINQICDIYSYIDSTGGNIFEDHKLCSSYYSKETNKYSDSTFFFNLNSSLAGDYENRDGKNYFENEGIDHLVITFYLTDMNNNESNRLSLTVTR